MIVFLPPVCKHCDMTEYMYCCPVTVQLLLEEFVYVIYEVVSARVYSWYQEYAMFVDR